MKPKDAIVAEVEAKIGMSKPKKAKLKPAQYRAIVNWAIVHKMAINPTGCGYYVESFNMFNACPCDRTRKVCPCPESIEEVQKDGHCLCRLFWRDLETFKQLMMKEA